MMPRSTAEKKNDLRARILNIQRMSTEDGPGIRTTVFFKGCGLSCSWCHNPESISSKPQIQWIENKCIGCKTCESVCPEHALSLSSEGMIINREMCTGCGLCASECPSTAMELLGKTWELGELLDEVVKDRAYFESSGGGITVSGGDPTVQAGFVECFLKECRERGLHTALDTCGLCNTRALDKLLPYTDLVLYDLKEIDSSLHERFTGNSNEKIFENIRYIRDYIRQHDNVPQLWLRTPLIPGATATEENISGLGAFIARELSDVAARWELCSFNNLCRDKYRRLGLDWQFKNEQLLTREFLEKLTETAKRSGIEPGLVQWTGATRVETRIEDRDTADKKPSLRLVKGCGTC
jgi:pyruvate formate lyase activating enzyme